jgi:multicomponent Na+:H+ antiporter subunit B
MRWVYIAIIVAVFARLAWLPASDGPATAGIVTQVVREAQVPNAVAGILLWNRLYDTIFEVLVFSMAVIGAQYTFSLHTTEDRIFHVEDATMVLLARIGAMVSSLVFLELSLRGHLAPGGGFAAGVAGGTAIGLVTLTEDARRLHQLYGRWKLASVEKGIVLVVLFVALAALLASAAGIPGSGWSRLAIPALNILIAVKVALGSWAVVLLFIRHRGLL